MNRLSLRPLLGLLIFLSLCGAWYFAGLPGVFLLAAAYVLCLLLALLWVSIQQLDERSNMSVEDALHLAQPTAAEEQKRAILRSLKDLEYELSVGKISREDFTTLSAQYRERAKELISAADESLAEWRREAEQLFEKEWEKQQKTAPPAPEDASS